MINPTSHTIHFRDSHDLSCISDDSVDLIVTSPPYPMIAMWDDLFGGLNPSISGMLQAGDGPAAFELMHRELDAVWREAHRVLKTGGFACVNIGDAVRTIDTQFRLYSNHARITTAFLQSGFDALPVILWRKTTNAPNKFMGSGMLPAGAYVTLEHEYILIFRKGGKRQFASTDEKAKRQESAFFWEERNRWFSDVWDRDVAGIRQDLKAGGLRERSAAYPIELAYRLINMYCVQGDTVLDPFSGTGTTMLAAMASGRNSVGIELDPGFGKGFLRDPSSLAEQLNDITRKRLEEHRAFITEHCRKKGDTPYVNRAYGFPVVTGQEVNLQLPVIREIVRGGEYLWKVSYKQGTDAIAACGPRSRKPSKQDAAKPEDQQTQWNSNELG